MAAATLVKLAVGSEEANQVLLTMEELGKRRAKKGKKVDPKPVRKMLLQAQGVRVVVDGPQGCGKTTLLSQLADEGFTIVKCPSQLQSERFEEGVFYRHVERWKSLDGA